MKRTNGFRIALFAFATMLFFTQCAKQQSAEQSTGDAAAATAVAEKSIKVAFVDIDSLLSKYEFSIILNKEMLRKEEDMRMKLSEKAKTLQADYDDFQRKLQNNVYATRERAEEEQARILKQKDALEKLEQRLIGELSAESQKNNITLHDSINSFLKAYNAEKKFDLILSRVGDNILFANDALNITEEVINGLNARYTPATKE
ncbi:MAG: OmpH family outer membrane protein [Bacteroidaceae bacterium]|jgi:outer membrane protein|nr:OmpH family outer membrane protein [Bacteroidaceae bacterium]